MSKTIALMWNAFSYLLVFYAILISDRDIVWGGLGPRGAQIPHFGRRRRPMKPHISAPKAPKFWKNSVFGPKNGILGQKRAKIGLFSKNCRFFENFRTLFENFRKILALIKPYRPKKWPKNAIKMKISRVDETPQKASPPYLWMIHIRF